MGWIIFICCCAAILLYFIFAPIFIEVDSEKELYGLRFHRLAAARFIFTRNTVFIELKIMFWRKTIDLLKKTERPRKKIVLKHKKDNVSNRKKFSISKLKYLLKSFKVNKCLINMDTGNPPLNGILFPFFYLLKQTTGKMITINFLNENKLILQIENNFARILWAFIKSESITNKTN